MCRGKVLQGFEALMQESVSSRGPARSLNYIDSEMRCTRSFRSFVRNEQLISAVAVTDGAVGVKIRSPKTLIRIRLHLEYSLTRGE